MAFDGYIPEQSIVATPPPLRMVEPPRIDTPEQRLALASQDLAEAQRSLDAFYDNAITGSRLNEDQKTLMGQLRADNDLTRLAKVVHTDEAGNAYTFADYFGDAEDVLVAAQKVIAARERAADVQTAAIKAVEMAKRAPAERRSDAVQPLGESAAQFEARFHQTWVSENDAARAHLDRIRAQFMTEARKMPFSELRVTAEAVPGDPFSTPQREAAPAPAAVETPNPYAFASPDEQTVVMPAVAAQAAPKKRWFERFAS